MTAFALAAQAAFLVLAFGVRTFLHWRDTGSTGFRAASARSLAEVAGVVLIVVAVALSVGGVVLDLAGVIEPWDLPLEPMWDVLGAACAVAAIVFVLVAQRDMGASWRIGVDTSEVTPLVTGGLFRYVRNPIFSGMLLFWLGIAFIVPNAPAVAAVIVALLGIEMQVRFVEEPYLLRRHPEQYGAYAASTGRLLPGIGKIGNDA